MMGSPGSNQSSTDSLQKSLHSLKEIRSALLPFLRVLKDDSGKHQRIHHYSCHSSTLASSSRNGKRGFAFHSNGDCITTQSDSQLNPHRRAEAQAAVALAVCTLRYMGGRLRGLDVGRKKDDPLRMELDKIRGVLVSLKKLEYGDAGDTSKDGADTDNCLNSRTGSQQMNGTGGIQFNSKAKTSTNTSEKRKEDMTVDMCGEATYPNKKQCR